MAELEVLQTFTTAVRAGSFAGAARVLGLTPAMVGRRIADLETEFGVRLIERTTRAQKLTEAGETFLVRAQAVLDAHAELQDSMRGNPGELKGRIRLTGPATLGVYRLAGLIAQFTEANPAVTIEAVLSDRRADIVAEGFDFAVRVGELQSSSMIAQHVGTYHLSLVAAPFYLSRHGTPLRPDELASARCILNLNMFPRNRWAFRRDGRREIVEVTGGLQIDNGEALRIAALEGAGVAYLPIDLVRDDLEAGRLKRVLPDWEMMTLPIQLVYPTRRVPRRVSALMETISAGLRTSHPI